MTGLGKALLLVGGSLALVGLLLLGLGKLGVERNFLGKLPGDLYFRTSRGTFHFPVATSIVVSAFLTLLSWLLRKGE